MPTAAHPACCTGALHGKSSRSPQRTADCHIAGPGIWPVQSSLGVGSLLLGPPGQLSPGLLDGFLDVHRLYLPSSSRGLL